METIRLPGKQKLRGLHVIHAGVRSESVGMRMGVGNETTAWRGGGGRRRKYGKYARYVA